MIKFIYDNIANINDINANLFTFWKVVIGTFFICNQPKKLNMTRSQEYRTKEPIRNHSDKETINSLGVFSVIERKEILR